MASLFRILLSTLLFSQGTYGYSACDPTDVHIILDVDFIRNGYAGDVINVIENIITYGSNEDTGLSVTFFGNIPFDTNPRIFDIQTTETMRNRIREVRFVTQKMSEMIQNITESTENETISLQDALAMVRNEDKPQRRKTKSSHRHGEHGKYTGKNDDEDVLLIFDYSGDYSVFNIDAVLPILNEFGSGENDNTVVHFITGLDFSETEALFSRVANETVQFIPQTQLKPNLFFVLSHILSKPFLFEALYEITCPALVSDDETAQFARLKPSVQFIEADSFIDCKPSQSTIYVLNDLSDESTTTFQINDILISDQDTLTLLPQNCTDWRMVYGIESIAIMNASDERYQGLLDLVVQDLESAEFEILEITTADIKDLSRMFASVNFSGKQDTQSVKNRLKKRAKRGSKKREKRNKPTDNSSNSTTLHNRNRKLGLDLGFDESGALSLTDRIDIFGPFEYTKGWNVSRSASASLGPFEFTISGIGTLTFTFETEFYLLNPTLEYDVGSSVGVTWNPVWYDPGSWFDFDFSGNIGIRAVLQTHLILRALLRLEVSATLTLEMSATDLFDDQIIMLGIVPFVYRFILGAEIVTETYPIGAYAQIECKYGYYVELGFDYDSSRTNSQFEGVSVFEPSDAGNGLPSDLLDGMNECVPDYGFLNEQEDSCGVTIGFETTVSIPVGLSVYYIAEAFILTELVMPFEILLPDIETCGACTDSSLQGAGHLSIDLTVSFVAQIDIQSLVADFLGIIQDIFDFFDADIDIAGAIEAVTSTTVPIYGPVTLWNNNGQPIIDCFEIGTVLNGAFSWLSDYLKSDCNCTNPAFTLPNPITFDTELQKLIVASKIGSESSLCLSVGNYQSGNDRYEVLWDEIDNNCAGWYYNLNGENKTFTLINGNPFYLTFKYWSYHMRYVYLVRSGHAIWFAQAKDIWRMNFWFIEGRMLGRVWVSVFIDFSDGSAVIQFDLHQCVLQYVNLDTMRPTSSPTLLPTSRPTYSPSTVSPTTYPTPTPQIECISAVNDTAPTQVKCADSNSPNYIMTSCGIMVTEDRSGTYGSYIDSDANGDVYCGVTGNNIAVAQCCDISSYISEISPKTLIEEVSTETSMTLQCDSGQYLLGCSASLDMSVGVPNEWNVLSLVTAEQVCEANAFTDYHWIESGKSAYNRGNLCTANDEVTTSDIGGSHPVTGSYDDIGVQCCFNTSGSVFAERNEDFDGNAVECMQGVSWLTAKAECESRNGSLCTLEEVQNDEGQGTGCNHDARRVWTSDDCHSEYYWIVDGNGGRNIEDLCVPYDEVSTTDREGSSGGIPYDDIAVQCCFINSSGTVYSERDEDRDGNATDCMQGVSWRVAESECINRNGRLCTAEEVRNNVGGTTGCSHDWRRVWTSDDCHTTAQNQLSANCVNTATDEIGLECRVVSGEESPSKSIADCTSLQSLGTSADWFLSSCYYAAEDGQSAYSYTHEGSQCYAVNIGRYIQAKAVCCQFIAFDAYHWIESGHSAYNRGDLCTANDEVTTSDIGGSHSVTGSYDDIGVQCCFEDTSGSVTSVFAERDEDFDGNAVECMQGVSWLTATVECESRNGRLCTLEEVQSDVGQGTGCNHDARRVWTSDQCPTAYHWIERGNFDSAVLCVSNDQVNTSDIGGSHAVTGSYDDIGVQCCFEDSNGERDEDFDGIAVDCMQKVSWLTAKVECENRNGRLCTLEEVQTGVGAATGCGHDYRRVWTSDECGLEDIVSTGQVIPKYEHPMQASQRKHSDGYNPMPKTASWDINVTPAWIFGFLMIILGLNVIFMTYVNCKRCNAGRVSFLNKRSVRYSAVKNADSEDFDPGQSEAQAINVISE